MAKGKKGRKPTRKPGGGMKFPIIYHEVWQEPPLDGRIGDTWWDVEASLIYGEFPLLLRRSVPPGGLPPDVLLPMEQQQIRATFFAALAVIQGAS